jgi:5-methylcytosine-specific restriction protein A
VARKLPKKPCTYPGCTELTDGKSSRCGDHEQPAWKNTASETGRRRTGRWLQRQREELFRHSPLCAACEAAGRVELATIRDHIVPLAEGGSDTPENTQGLCRACSDAKSEAERQRGYERHPGRQRDGTSRQPDDGPREMPIGRSCSENIDGGEGG